MIFKLLKIRIIEKTYLNYLTAPENASYLVL